LRSKRIGVTSLTFQGHMTSSVTLPFLADRTNGRAIAILLRLSVVCDAMYCG